MSLMGQGKAKETTTYISTIEAAKIIGCDRRTVTRLVLRGQLPGAFKLSYHSSYAIPMEAVKAYIAKKSGQPASTD